MSRSALPTPRSLRIVCALLLVVCGKSTIAQEVCTETPDQHGNGAVQIEVLPRMHMVFQPEVLENQRAFQDIDGNKVPDLVQNTIFQLRVANRWYSKLFELPSPLASKRYEHVDSLQLCIESLNRGNGFAISRPICGQRAGGESKCVLRMQVGAHVRPRNLTPAHELFHLYQYTYNRFRQPWLIEGTARWAEGAFSSQQIVQAPLPQTEAALQRMLTGSYEVGAVWNRLTLLLDPEGIQGLSPQEAPERYVTGEFVWAQRPVHGATFIRDVFRALSEISRVESTDFEPKKVPHSSTASDAEVWATVQKIARLYANRGTSTPELERFLSLQGPFKAAAP